MKKFLMMMFLGVVLFVAVGCSEPTTGEEAGPSTIDNVVRNGKLVVGTAPGYFPFEMIDVNGEFIGYDMDTARAIAASLDVDVEFKQYEFSALIPALQTGEIDLIIAGMTIRGDRALAVSFANPYFETGQVLMVPGADSASQSWKDLDQAGKQIAVSLGTTGALLAEQLYKEAEIKYFDDFPTAAMALVQGQADGIIYDEPGVRSYEAMNPGAVRGVYDLISSENLGIAVRHNDLRTVQWLNSFLYNYKGSPAELESFDKWFNNVDWMDQVDE